MQMTEDLRMKLIYMYKAEENYEKRYQGASSSQFLQPGMPFNIAAKGNSKNPS